MAEASFRPATEQDNEAIRRLIFSVFAEYGFEPAPDGIDADLYDIKGFYKGGAFELLIGASGALMGTLGLKRLDDKRCELRKMYLARAYRGKGHGKRLLDRAIACARELGFSRIELETATVLKEAIGLYQSYGFARIESGGAAGRCDKAYALDL